MGVVTIRIVSIQNVAFQLHMRVFNYCNLFSCVYAGSMIWRGCDGWWSMIWRGCDGWWSMHEYLSLQVNEIAWNKENDQFFLTNGNGCVVILR